MRSFMPALRLTAAGVLCAAFAAAQTSPLLSPAEAQKIYMRSVQLLESTSVTVPGLVRAAAPVLENANQTLQTLRAQGGQQHAGLTYSFLSSLRAYLQLADSLPKPFPFPEEGRRQFAELREAVDRIESHYRALLERKEFLLRNPDRDNLQRYAEANRKLPAPVPGSPRVVFLGDSITDGWRLNEYFPDRDFVNRGISGQVTGEMLGRMKADVLDLRPALVVILAGTNDIARQVPNETIQANLYMLASLAEAHQIKVVLASVLPISDHHKAQNPQYERSLQRPPQTILALNSWIESFCKKHGFAYLDYFSHMVDTAGQLKAELADDGLHPNAAGYRVMAPLAAEIIGKMIPPPGPQQKKRRWPF